MEYHKYLDVKDVIESKLSKALRKACKSASDPIPPEWAQLFKCLVDACKKGFPAHTAIDYVRGSPCYNSKGFAKVMIAAFENRGTPVYDDICKCDCPKLLASAYRHGLVPEWRHFCAMHSAEGYLDVLAAAYGAGYVPNPSIDFYGNVWTRKAVSRAWELAESHGVRKTVELLLRSECYDLLEATFEISPEDVDRERGGSQYDAIRAVARRQLLRKNAVHSVFGRDVGGLIMAKLIPSS